MSPSPTRGYGLFEGFMAKQRHGMADRLIPNTLRSERLLDIGCGAYPQFLINTEFSQKYGLDLIKRSDQIDVFRDKQIELVQHDYESNDPLPFENDHFSVVTMIAVLEHVQPQKVTQVLREVHRVLKRGGKFVLTVPAGWTDSLMRVLARLRLISSVEVDDHKDTYTHAKIRSALDSAGFQTQELQLGFFELGMNLWGTVTK